MCKKKSAGGKKPPALFFYISFGYRERSRGTGPRATVSSTACFTVGRGPVPRYAPIARETRSEARPRTPVIRGLKRSRGTGPRATVSGTAPLTVGRGPVPRHANRLNQDLQDSRICRISSRAATKPLLKKRLFRSFRSCMSIDKRVGPFSRSVRTLIACEPRGADAH